MKKITILLALILLIACKEERTVIMETNEIDSIVELHDSIPPEVVNDIQPIRKFSNDRFRNVSAKLKQGNTYVISGEAQIFEASFNWVIEDGHDEIMSGYATTDAGAPEWGNFEFEVTAKKVRDNSTLNMILYEASAKDGSRQHELPVLLY